MCGASPAAHAPAAHTPATHAPAALAYASHASAAPASAAHASAASFTPAVRWYDSLCLNGRRGCEDPHPKRPMQEFRSGVRRCRLR